MKQMMQIIVRILLLCLTVFGLLKANAQVPTVTSFSPKSGNAGTSVTIIGTNFSTTPTNNVVYFGIMKGTVTTASATSLQVTTPLGATYGPLTVINTTTGLVTISTYNFMPTYSGGTPGFKYRQTWENEYEGTVVSDFDGDGKSDFAPAGPVIYKNNSVNGVASFSNPVGTDVSYMSHYELKYADFNGDGKLDVFGGTHTATLVNGAYHTDLAISKNTSTTGSVSFAAAKKYFYVNDVPGRFFTGKSRAGDFDMDGKLDIVVYDYDHYNTISIYRNQSTISNIDFAAKFDLPSNLQSGFITSEQPLVGDINEDGKPDLIFGTSSTTVASDCGFVVYLNTSTGVGNISFASPVFFNFNMVALPVALKYADINNDGKMDIIGALFSTYPTPGNSFVCLNTSTTGSVSFAAPLVYGTPKKSDVCELSDINGDGKLDYVTLNSFDGDSSVYVFTNTSVSNTNLSFDTTKYRIKSQKGWGWGEVTIGDLDNDGKPDIVVGKADYYSGSYNSNTGSYPHSTSILFNGYAPPTSTVIANIDTFSVCNNLSSATQSFTVASTYLPANMVISVPSSLEISLSPNSGFGSIITITPVAGAIATTTIYVRAPAVNSTGLSTFTGAINVSSDAIIPVSIPAVVMYNKGNWNGHTNNNFNIATNWTGCYPAANIDITIPNVATSPLLTQVGTLKDLTINAGANLEITGKLQISGNVSNLGVFDADNGTVELNNSLGGSAFISAINPANNKIHRLIVNQTSVYVNAKLYVDSITLTQGTLSNADSLNVTQAITKTTGTIDCNTAATNVIIFNGTVAQTLPISYFTNKTLQHLVVSNTTGVTTIGNVTVNNKLTLKGGILIASNDTINLPSAGLAVSTNNGYVDGNVRKTGNSAFTFPVGNGGKYAPISIGLSSSSSDQFTASYVKANPNSLYSTSSLGTGLVRVSQAEYWLLKRTGGTNAQTVTLSWDSSRSVAPGIATNARVAGWDGTKWVNQGNTATTGNLVSGTVKSNTGINTFGAFTLGSSTVVSANADLFSLTVNGVSPSPTFNANTLKYTSSQSNSVTDASIVPQAADASAMVYINGVYATNGYIIAPLNIGDNTFTIKVVAGDGVTTKTYTLIVNRATTSNADLKNLVVSQGSLTPSFNSSTINYLDTVVSTISSITVTPTTLNVNSPSNIKVNGITVNSGSATGAISLNFGNNTINTVVTSIDSSTIKTYTINVFRKADNNCNLSALVVNTATISPVFATATTSYTASVANTTTSVTIKPTTSVTTATVMVNGVSVTSGSNSGSIPLSVGANVVNIVVTAQDGTTTKTYTVTITRAGGTNANLAALSLSSGTLSPAFSTSTISYTASVANNVTSVNITPTLSDVDGSLKVNNVSSPSGTAYGPISLNIGNNTITVVATASNGTTTKTYTVTVTRATSTNNNLSDLVLSSGTLSPVFVKTTTAYTASVPYVTTSITVTPTVEDATATVKVNNVTVISGVASGAIALNYGSNTINVVVTSQSNATKTYTITVTRLGSSNPDLSALIVNNGTLVPAFASATTTYFDTVANSVTSTSVRPTVTDVGTTIKVNGVTTNSGLNSSSITLAVGNNTINVITTSGDGSANKTYTINVYRLPSSNANLAALSLFSGAISPTFAPTTTSYTSTVTSTTASTYIVPTLSDATASIKLNGVSVTSGTATLINLSYGANTFNVVVTAQDGTTKTYTVVVTRPISTNANLTSLYLSSGQLSPVFTSNNTSYTVNVAGTVSTTTFVASLSDVNATMKINGATLTNNSASGIISLSYGANTVNIVVTAQDGVTTKTYTITVNRSCNTVTSTTNLSVCANQLPLTWNGLTFSGAGSQTAHITLPSGCDSAATLVLAMNQPITNTVNTNICSGGSYVFNGVTYTKVGTHTATFTSSNGCDSIVTVNISIGTPTTPSVSIAADQNNICLGAAITFTATPVNGGASPSFIWKKNGANIIGSSNTATQVFAPGTLANNDTVSCEMTANNACQTTATANSNKVGMILKSGPNIGLSTGGIICTIGGTLTIYNGNTNGGGVWTSDNASVATVSTIAGANGTVIATGSGTVTMTYTKTSSNGCKSIALAVVIVAPVAAPSAITAPIGLCKGASTTLTNATPNGVWKSLTASTAIIDSVTGVATGVYQGTATIRYTVKNAYGCSNFASISLPVNNVPSVPTINYASVAGNPQVGPNSSFCVNDTFSVIGKVSPVVAGTGAWSSSNPAVVTISNAGLIKIVSVGTTSITYTFTSSVGCSNSRTVTGVNTAICPGHRGANSNSQFVSSNDFTIYPNPARTSINLNIKTLVGAGTIVVTDLYGKQVKTQSLSMGSNTVDVSNLAKGFYLVSTITEQGETTKKLVVE